MERQTDQEGSQPARVWRDELIFLLGMSFMLSRGTQAKEVD